MGAGAAASAIAGGRFTEVAGTVTNAAVPESLKPVKETAGAFLSKAQSWRAFLLPLSVPTASDGCVRFTANVYNFQTNYAILFVGQLLLSIILQPSALISVVGTIIAWIFFLKKNDDPNWKPEIGGVQLGPIQRWTALAAITGLILLSYA